MLIKWKKEEYNSASRPETGHTYTAYHQHDISDENKKNLEKYLKQRKSHGLERMTTIMLTVVIIMAIVAIVRQYFFPMPSLFQFIVNITVVIFFAWIIHKEANYKLTQEDKSTLKDIGSFDILDEYGTNVTISIEDNKSILETRFIQIFFGFLIALSFFFTQTTTTLSVDCSDINETSKRH